jgi:hypothetical protein
MLGLRCACVTRLIQVAPTTHSWHVLGGVQGLVWGGRALGGRRSSALQPAMQTRCALAENPCRAEQPAARTSLLNRALRAQDVAAARRQRSDVGFSRRRGISGAQNLEYQNLLPSAWAQQRSRPFRHSDRNLPALCGMCSGQRRAQLLVVAGLPATPMPTSPRHLLGLPPRCSSWAPQAVRCAMRYL